MNIVIILAAGNSQRMRGIDKIFYQVKKKPLIFYTISVFEKHSQIQRIILVVRKRDVAKFSSLIKQYQFKKIAAVIEGGGKRQDSAFKGLKAAEKLGAKPKDLILFHNAANPLVLEKEISAVIKAAKKYGTALLAQLAKDTIKKVDKNNFIVNTLDRKEIYLAQTPQVIEYELAKKAFKTAFEQKFYGTDDVSLVERLLKEPSALFDTTHFRCLGKKRVKVVPCSYKNIKVTFKEDLKIVKTLL